MPGLKKPLSIDSGSSAFLFADLPGDPAPSAMPDTGGEDVEAQAPPETASEEPANDPAPDPATGHSDQGTHHKPAIHCALPRKDAAHKGHTGSFGAEHGVPADTSNSDGAPAAGGTQVADGGSVTAPDDGNGGSDGSDGYLVFGMLPTWNLANPEPGLPMPFFDDAIFGLIGPNPAPGAGGDTAGDAPETGPTIDGNDASTILVAMLPFPAGPLLEV